MSNFNDFIRVFIYYKYIFMIGIFCLNMNEKIKE